MKRRWLLALAFLSFGLFQPFPIFAGRPLITEDAGTVEKRSGELELAFDYARESNRDQIYSPSAQLACGLTERTELALASGFLFQDNHDQGRENGWGDTTLYLKYRLWEEGEIYPAFALKPHAKIPTADERKGHGSGKTDVGLNAIFTKGFEPVTFHFNLGYTRIGEKGATDEINLNLAGEYQWSKDWVAVSEFRYTRNFNAAKSDDPATILFGCQFQLAEKAMVDAGFTLGLNRAAPDYAFIAGVTIKFP